MIWSNPWTRAADAERRAAIAEERSAICEQNAAWLRDQFERAEKENTRSIKIMANIAAQRGFGFTPYPEVAGLPDESDTALPPEALEQFQIPPRPRDEASKAFELAEMKRWNEMHATAEN